MKTIYIDSDFKCHVTDDGTMTAVKTNFFDGKCDTLIEGYRYIPEGYEWTKADGEVFIGTMISPWKDYAELDFAQRSYEKQLLDQYEAELAELDAALLEVEYQNLIGGL